MGLHTLRAGAAIAWRSHISLARVRVSRAPMCHRWRAASSRTPVWRRASVLSAAPARKSKPAAPCRP
eukprot:576307-Prymnesium_polylepis.1